MTGRRLLIGVIAMAGIVPAILFYFLELSEPWQWFTIASTCMLAWGIADFTANLVVRPRLRDRQPTDAIRGWDPWRDPERRVSGAPDRRGEDET
jgi:hypothetical protein